MNQNNRQNFSLNNRERAKEKIIGNYQPGQWLRLNHWRRFSYLTLAACIVTVVVTFLSPAYSSIGQSVANSPVVEGINEGLILAQEEEVESTEEEAESTEEEVESTEEEVESTEEEVESTEEEVESTEEEVESAEEEVESTEEEVESAEEEVESTEEKVESTEEEVESTEEEVESAEEEVPFAEAKKSLEEEIDERYEEWEAKKASSVISHSISSFATILMTVVIAALGLELFEVRYKKQIIVILGIITVLIQFNVNIFLLEKSLAGYEILAEQGMNLKGKLEFVKTDEELTEVREQFQELVLESVAIE
ncbi:MAG: hypothetical protein QNJ55_05685 [Xenococcus sp. MO_188.B8]|nr:hypothetical protein [Xenococcus sp. MO_188.B8]